jgi:protein phosphatase
VAIGSTLDYCDRTDVGRRRSNNQDAKAVLEPWNRDIYNRRGWLFVVADGMGAHAAGEMASAIAAEQVPLVYEKLAGKSPARALRQAIEQANTEIHSKGESSVDLKGMGTTCTTLVLVPRGALVGHVGDSRAYRVRGRRIEQLSRDHSLVWELQDLQAAGEAVPGLDLRETPKNIITRSLGPHPWRTATCSCSAATASPGRSPTRRSASSPARCRRGRRPRRSSAWRWSAARPTTSR